MFYCHLSCTNTHLKSSLQHGPVCFILWRNFLLLQYKWNTYSQCGQYYAHLKWKIQLIILIVHESTFTWLIWSLFRLKWRWFHKSKKAPGKVLLMRTENIISLPKMTSLWDKFHFWNAERKHHIQEVLKLCLDLTVTNGGQTSRVLRFVDSWYIIQIFILQHTYFIQLFCWQTLENINLTMIKTGSKLGYTNTAFCPVSSGHC